MSSNLSSHQSDLFEKPVFETREPLPQVDLDRFRSRIKRAMSSAISESGMGRDQLVETVSELPGIGSFSRSMLDNYTSESKQHDISLVRFKAIARVLRAADLWDLAVSEEGLIILRGDEPKLAEIARLQQEKRKIDSQLRKLRSSPVHINRDGT